MPVAETENYDVNVFNQNSAKIDAALTPTADPSQAPSGNGPGKLVQWISWLTNRIKAITGESNWHNTPATTLKVAKAHADAAAPHTGHETPDGALAKAVAAVAAHENAADPHEQYALYTDLNGHKDDTATLSTLGHVKHGIHNVTLDTSWSGSSAPYSKTVTVSGILAADTPIVDVVMSGTYATDDARQKAWSKIYRIVTAANQITLYATVKPTVSLPIQLKVVR